MLNTFSRTILLFCLSSLSQAQLVPIDEVELSNTIGQAFIRLDNSSSDGLDFTRVSLGLDVKTSLNADLVEFGNYKRSASVIGNDPGGTAGADIQIRDFALGSINSDGSINPFKIKDPFIELAFDPNNKQNLVGVRVGFGGAVGEFSGLIESLTGNINIDIKDTAAGLAPAGGLGSVAAFLLNSAPINAKAQLVDGAGRANSIRATEVGIPNGKTFDIYARSGFWNFGDRIALGAVNLLPGTSCSGGCNKLSITANNCSALGIGVCFPLASYQTLNVGTAPANANQDTPISSFTEAAGLFLSFQSQEVKWSVAGGDSVTTSPGAFLNIPNGGLTVNLNQALLGTDRVRTKFTDPYYD